MLVTQPNLMKSGTAVVSPIASSSQFCKAHSAASPTWTLNPADVLAGLQDGDYVILVTNSTQVNKTPPLSVPLWTYLCTAGGGATGGQHGTILGKFWDAAAATQTFTIHQNGTGSTCISAYAFRGVSRRKPVEIYPIQMQVGGVTGDQLSPYFPPWRPRNPSGALALQVCFFRANESTSPVATTDDSLIHRTTNWAFDHQSAGLQHSFSIVGVHHTGRLANLGGTYADLTRSFRGFSSSSGAYWKEESASADYERWVLYTTGVAARQWTYEAATISATAGQDLILTASMRIGPDPNLSSDTRFGLSFQKPDGNIVFSGFEGSRRSLDYDGEFNGAPDWISHWSSAGSDKIGMTGMIGIVAPTTGNYIPRIHLLKQAATKSWTPGTNPATEYKLGNGIRYYGAGTATNNVPFLQGTVAGGAEEFSYDDYVPPVVIKFPVSTSYAMVVPNTLVSVTIEILPASGSLTSRPTRMVSNYQIPDLLWLDSTHLSLSASSQPQGASGNGGGIGGLSLCADTCILPTYRTTEGGADTNGKYYFEVTCNEADADSDMLPASVIRHGAPWQEIVINGFGTPGDNSAIHVRGDGNVINYGTILGDFGSIASNDVLSFAIDVVGKSYGVYRNGALIFTGDSTNDDTDPTQADRLAFQLAAELHDSLTANYMHAVYNLRGPFTYSKPGGYVAWDWPNELP